MHSKQHTQLFYPWAKIYVQHSGCETLMWRCKFQHRLWKNINYDPFSHFTNRRQEAGCRKRAALQQVTLPGRCWWNRPPAPMDWSLGDFSLAFWNPILKLQSSGLGEWEILGVNQGHLVNPIKCQRPCWTKAFRGTKIRKECIKIWSSEMYSYCIRHAWIQLPKVTNINGHFRDLNWRYLPHIRPIRPM